MQVDRRKFLSIGLGTAVGTAALVGLSSSALADCGLLTPPQTKGPFYPGEASFKVESDLTLLRPGAARALGQVIYIKGRVTDPNCVAIANANVEIWQACASGKYNNPNDPNPAAIDPNFRYWSEVFTDANGDYMFKTIIPGAYPASADWMRPPHVHYKVSALAFNELATQMYFKGDPLNAHDLILQQTPLPHRENLVVEFTPAPAGFEPGALMGSFDITLTPVRRTPRV
jgi:protocatechuate 3,4-dioxygenase, beta subunit